MVADEQHFDVVLNDFNQWLHSLRMITEDYSQCLRPFTFVTCGDWDLQMMFPKQCRLLNIERQRHFRTWINIKKSYASNFKVWPKSLSFMLNELQIKPLGRLHSGIDDCRNVVLIMREMTVLSDRHRDRPVLTVIT